MKTTITAIIILIAAVSQLYAGSIWAKRNTNLRQPYTDEVARKVGDVLTIKIDESATIANEVKRVLSKKTDSSITFDGELGIKTDNHNLLPRIPAINMETASDKSLTGKSKFDDTRSIIDEITVVVEDVLPNGNLVVVGSRVREVAGDTQEIRVSGIVRPTDITYTNTISSEKVANFQLVFANKGYSETYNKTGWLTNIFDTLWPF